MMHRVILHRALPTPNVSRPRRYCTKKEGRDVLYGSSGLPQWRVGDKQSLSKSWSREEVEAFSKLSLDDNKIHLDPEFAAKTPFKKCIVHGMLTASLISAVLGTKLPGKGSIYLSQTLQFKAPVYIDETVTATAEITAIHKKRPILTLSTIVKNQADQVVITGEAVALVDPTTA